MTESVLRRLSKLDISRDPTTPGDLGPATELKVPRRARVRNTRFGIYTIANSCGDAYTSLRVLAPAHHKETSHAEFPVSDQQTPEP